MKDKFYYVLKDCLSNRQSWVRETEIYFKFRHLKEKANNYTRNLSGGMQRRLLIAKALVHKPPIVILDEPTAGVDVELRKKLLESVKSLRSIGVTIILTTHYLSEAENMCDRIGIINKGNLIALDTTENMLNKIQTKIVKFSVSKKVKLIDNVKSQIKVIKNDEKELIVSYEKNIINIQEIIDLVKSQKIDIFDVQSRDPDLEDVFVKLIKN